MAFWTLTVEVPDELEQDELLARGLRGRRRRRPAPPAPRPGAWVDWIEPYTAEMLRVLSSSGSMMLNLGVVLRDGEEHSCTDDIIRQARGQGWKLIHRRVWAKPNGQVPSSPGYLTVAHEFIAWMAPRTDCWRAFTEPPGSVASRQVRSPHSPASVSRMGALYSGAGTHRKQSSHHELHPDGARPTTVLTASVGGEPNPRAHPARMPLKVAIESVAMVCPPDGLVFDPFAGNATTGVAAQRLGRRFVGVEIDELYAEQARERLRGDVAVKVGEDVPHVVQLGLGL